MAAPIFDAIALELEEATALDRLQARGTLRIVLKTAGLEASNLKGGDLAVAIEVMLTKELAASTARG